MSDESVENESGVSKDQFNQSVNNGNAIQGENVILQTIVPEKESLFSRIMTASNLLVGIITAIVGSILVVGVVVVVVVVDPPPDVPNPVTTTQVEGPVTTTQVEGPVITTQVEGPVVTQLGNQQPNLMGPLSGSDDSKEDIVRPETTTGVPDSFNDTRSTPPDKVEETSTSISPSTAAPVVKLGCSVSAKLRNSSGIESAIAGIVRSDGLVGEVDWDVFADQDPERGIWNENTGFDIYHWGSDGWLATQNKRLDNLTFHARIGDIDCGTAAIESIDGIPN